MKDSGRLLCMLGHLCLRPEGLTRYSAKQAHLRQTANRRGGLEFLGAHRQEVWVQSRGSKSQQPWLLTIGLWVYQVSLMPDQHSSFSHSTNTQIHTCLPYSVMLLL